MAFRSERGGLRDLADETLESSFDRVREPDVVDGAAGHAHEVVVMAAQPLGELVARDASGSVVRIQDARRLEDGERAIERRQGHRP